MVPVLRVAMLSIFLLSTLSAQAQSPEIINKKVAVYRDLTFTNTPDGPIQLDLYLPRSGNQKVPPIIVIPGGGFKARTKEAFANRAQFLAGQGFAAASIGYRGIPGNTFYDTIHDVKAAVRFIRANAGQYNLDPDHLGVFGHSAGAHLAAMMGTTGDEPSLEGNGGSGTVSSRVQAVVCYAGAFDFSKELWAYKEKLREQKNEGDDLSVEVWLGEPFDADGALWKLASPINHIDADDPPMLLVHSKDDNIVPYQTSVQMFSALKDRSPSSQLLILEKGSHTIMSAEIPRKRAATETIEFFRRHLRP